MGYLFHIPHFVGPTFAEKGGGVRGDEVLCVGVEPSDDVDEVELPVYVERVFGFVYQHDGFLCAEEEHPE